MGSNIGIVSNSTFIVRAFDSFDSLAAWQPQTPTVLQHFKFGSTTAVTVAPDLHSPLDTDGIYGRLGHTTAILCRVDQALVCCVDQLLDRFDQFRFKWRSVGSGVSELKVRRGADTLSVEYWTDSPPPWDTTAFAEPEHSDFGLMLRNLASDPSRQLRMFSRSEN